MFGRLLEILASELDRVGIPYMVIGGQAVLRYGEPRLTKDIDLTLGVDLDRLPDVLAVARACALEVLVDPDEFVRRTMVLPCRHAESGIRVDLVFSFSPYEREAIRRAQPVALGAVQVRFATAEDLVIHKVVAGRPRDLEDIRGVLLKNPAIDREMIMDVLSEVASGTDEPLLDRFRSVLKDLDRHSGD